VCHRAVYQAILDDLRWVVEHSAGSFEK
jgi:hypothetical protein